ncbi:protein phosphatase methylesterase 1-like isoform X4 [Gordionus sp. m RMFG-2023]|uniref:protein phosphatase methylesterase 1-like isoform X4 n=1 Tax=Gordionus sp. m RMFG-2023 TaxID=3053472 RepID=UPI0031FBAA08
MIKKVFHLPPHTNIHKSNLNFEPTSWEKYFDHKDGILIGDNKFNVYTKGILGPVLFFIHGGGFSGLSWALLVEDLSKLIDCRYISMDLRGHGETQTMDDLDLSIETLTKDVLGVLTYLFSATNTNIILVGHSMGGGVAAHVAEEGVSQSIDFIKGIILVDVVEGTAIDALSGMQSYLRSRPKSFDSVTKAIEWSVKNGQIKNVDSAKVSVPGELKKINYSSPEYAEFSNSHKHSNPAGKYSSIPENCELDDVHMFPAIQKPTEDSTKSVYVWRAQLDKSGKFWEGWFKGLSKMFINLPIPKLLILAGVDHLDKELTIAQMQGKFQMVILSRCGHSVHEDLPDEVAGVVASFLAKHKMVVLANPNMASIEY